MAFYQLRKQQVIQASLEELWDFVSSPVNLKQITPASMGFDIISAGLPEKMYPGMIIRYRVKPFAGIPMQWVTEITHVEERKFFIDEQRIGPYSFWHHQHLLEPLDNGILMTDIVSYQPPFGLLGRFANFLFIRRQLDTIFRYREKALQKKFPSPE
jgi:ligand-binding SRPBCC domain-containing protein